MASSKIIAVVIAGILVISGVALFALKGNGPADEITLSAESNRLPVFGNVNNDDYLDSKDMNALEKVISGEYKLTDHPYADVNCDGAVDEKDKALLIKIIAREPCTINYIDGKDAKCSINYPVETFVVGGTALHQPLTSIGAISKAIAKTGTNKNIDPTLLPKSLELKSVSDIAYKINKDSVSNLSKTPDAIFTLASNTYDNIADTMNGTGINVVRIDADSSEKVVNMYLLMGFLLGCEKDTEKLVKFYDTTRNKIKAKVESISEANRKTTLSLYSYSVCGKNYYPTKNTELAGGVNLAKFSDNSKSCKTDIEWLLTDEYRADYLVEYTSWNYKKSDLNVKGMYDSYGNYFKKHSAYPNNYFVVNKDMIDVIRAAYVASVLYKDVFGADFGDLINQEYMDKFFPNLNYNVKNDGIFLITADMAKP